MPSSAHFLGNKHYRQVEYQDVVSMYKPREKRGIKYKNDDHLSKISIVNKFNNITFALNDFKYHLSMVLYFDIK